MSIDKDFIKAIKAFRHKEAQKQRKEKEFQEINQIKETYRGRRMSERYSEHLDRDYPECNICDSPLGFNDDEFKEGDRYRCFTCSPLGSMLYDEIVND